MTRRLTILHVMRAPVGGLFRHVADLAGEQAARGHRVGIVADSTTGGERGERVLADLDKRLACGVTRIAMSRQIGWSDVSAALHVGRRIKDMDADVVHGHGAKGGAYARLMGAGRVRVYTPHGGSLYFDRSTAMGLVYLTLEQVMQPRTDLFLFESGYASEALERKVARPRGLVRIVHNGVTEAEFAPVALRPDATDLLFIGELRDVKGIDVLLDAIRILHEAGRKVTATIVGGGPDDAKLKAQTEALGLSGYVTFTGVLPAREAFTRGRRLVVPSRHESLPYVILEAAAAGVPLTATRVGGIHEIFGPDADRLIPREDAGAIVAAVSRQMDDPADAEEFAARLRARVDRSFSIRAMTDGVLAAYGEALAARAGASIGAPASVSQ